MTIKEVMAKESQTCELWKLQLWYRFESWIATLSYQNEWRGVASQTCHTVIDAVVYGYNKGQNKQHKKAMNIKNLSLYKAWQNKVNSGCFVKNKSLNISFT